LVPRCSNNNYGKMDLLAKDENKDPSSTNTMDRICMKDIVESFSAGINEEQAWAIVHQTLLFHRKYLANSSLTSGNNIASDKTLMYPDPDNLYLDKDGLVTIMPAGSDCQENISKFLNNKFRVKLTLLYPAKCL
jgi:hypothetical protein